MIKVNGIFFIERQVANPSALYNYLESKVDWDNRMKARKTASFGVAYNYSQISYPDISIPTEIAVLIEQLIPIIGFEANNCLINYYPDGKSKMGFHSDQIDILDENTGIAILSIGAPRVLRFRDIKTKELKKDFELVSGSLFYMNASVQKEFQHAILPSSTTEGRMSLTFRKLKV